MNFELSDEQKLMIGTARRVGAKFSLEYWRDRDQKHEFADHFWNAVCAAGLCGILIPEKYGGSGLGMVELALVIEELAASGGGSTLGQIFMNNPIFGGVSIARFGSEDLKHDCLPKLAAGKMKFCMALTEPNAGANSLKIDRATRTMGGMGYSTDMHVERLWRDTRCSSSPLSPKR